MKKEQKPTMEYLDAREPIPYENNARDNDEAVPFLMNSIHDSGFINPVILDKDDVIVAGHTRIKAAKALLESGDCGLWGAPPEGMSPSDPRYRQYQCLAPLVTCVRVTNLTPEGVMAYRLADNKVQDYSGWDFEKLDIEMAKLDEKIDLSRFGFDLAPLTFDIKEPEKPLPEARGDTFDLPPVSDTYDGARASYKVMAFVSTEEEADDLVEYLESMGDDAKKLR